jgi:penicillin-binding protein 2
MGSHGTLTVKDAIKRSCNTFFFTVMMRNDFQRWSQWGERFGFGVKMPTDLPEQIPGIFPDSTYFDRRYGKGKWTRGFLVSLGVGQGDLGITPLQLARYCSAVANGGMLHPPHLVRQIIRSDTGELVEPEIPDSERIPIEPRYFEMVREGMRRMVMENNSTVRWGDVVLGGKTGTAQNPHGKDHAWFMGFAPFEDPQIAVAVLVENAGFGASVSAPIGGLMMEQYLTGQTSQHPAWVHAMARNNNSEGMEDGSGTVWHRAPGRRDIQVPTEQSGSTFASAGGG